MIGETMLSEEEVTNLTHSLHAEIKTLRQSLRYARKRADHAEIELEKVKADKMQFKDFCVAKFNWLVDIHAEGKTPSTPYLIKEFTKLFNRVQPFYWG